MPFDFDKEENLYMFYNAKLKFSISGIVNLVTKSNLTKNFFLILINISINSLQIFQNSITDDASYYRKLKTLQYIIDERLLNLKGVI